MVTIIGGANIDIQGRPAAALRPRDSNPGSVSRSPGGVARNIAENLVRLGVPVRFLGVFGDDAEGHALLDGLRSLGVDVDGAEIVAGGRTSTYLCVLEQGGALYAAVSDMTIVDAITPRWLEARIELVTSAELVVIDANLSAQSIGFLAERCRHVSTLVDPVSVAKASRVRPWVGSFSAVKPNREEIETLTGVRVDRDERLAEAAARLHDAGTESVFVSLGSRGIYFSRRARGGASSGAARHGIALRPELSVVNVNGAGDAAAAAIAFGIVQHRTIEETARLAVAAAAHTAQSAATVSERMSVAALTELASSVIVEEP